MQSGSVFTFGSFGRAGSKAGAASALDILGKSLDSTAEPVEVHLMPICMGSIHVKRNNYVFVLVSRVLIHYCNSLIVAFTRPAITFIGR